MVGTRAPAAGSVVRKRYVAACITRSGCAVGYTSPLDSMPLGQRDRVLAWVLLLLISPSVAALADDTLIGWQGEQYREPGADLRRVRIFPAAQPVHRIARIST